MNPTGDERQDLGCREALNNLFKYVFNEVSRLLKDYPSQSNTICEETSRLAVELQSLITYQKRHLSGSNVTTEDLVLFVTSMLALGDVTKILPQIYRLLPNLLIPRYFFWEIHRMHRTAKHPRLSDKQISSNLLLVKSNH